MYVTLILYVRVHLFGSASGLAAVRGATSWCRGGRNPPPALVTRRCVCAAGTGARARPSIEDSESRTSVLIKLTMHMCHEIVSSA